MKKNINFIILCLGVTLWLASVSYAQRADNPVFQDGDSWSFNVTKRVWSDRHRKHCAVFTKCVTQEETPRYIQWMGIKSKRLTQADQASSS
jgi:hypothetical protein